MKRATVRDLRNNFPRVAVWVEKGETVEITRSGKVIAHLCPARENGKRALKMPDVKRRLEHLFGDACYESKDLTQGIQESRGDS